MARTAWAVRLKSGAADVDLRDVHFERLTIESGNATFTLNAYSTPSAQGLTLGATPGGPAPSLIAPEATPASTVAP